MKKLLPLIFCLLLTSQAWAEIDVITDFSDGSIPVVNEIIRQLQNNIDTLDATVDALPPDTDIKAKVSASDTTTGYLYDKLIAGSNVTITKNNAASNETMTFAVSVPTTGGIGANFDNGTSKVATGTKQWVYMPYACTITGWTILADVANIGLAATYTTQIDVWKDTYANYPPTAADKISGSESPHLISTLSPLSRPVKNQDLSLTTWTDVTVEAGDVLMFNVTYNGYTATGGSMYVASSVPKKIAVTLMTTR